MANITPEQVSILKHIAHSDFVAGVHADPEQLAGDFPVALAGLALDQIATVYDTAQNFHEGRKARRDFHPSSTA